MTYSLTLRRQRQTPAIRDLFANTTISATDLIQPYFIYESLPKDENLSAIPGQKKHTLDSLKREIEWSLKNDIHSILLFIIPKNKYDKNFQYNFDLETITSLKNNFGDDLILFTDICLCSNTKSGHCGLLNDQGRIENENSVEELTKKACLYAEAGADVLAPSDMMDGRIESIRDKLDDLKYYSKLIMSYSTKFSSNLYGPFRDAADSSPAFGDRKSYQIDPRNLNDAIQSSIRDKKQGADILMVKPAGAYLDVIQRLKNHPDTCGHPLCAYQVSGEYKSLHLMSEAGFMDFSQAYEESLVAIKRAGANFIITYGATEYTHSKKEKRFL